MPRLRNGDRVARLVPVLKIPTGYEEGPIEEPTDPRSNTTFRILPHVVEPRGLEPLTPTLPVWCATSCATAPRARHAGHPRNVTHSRTGGHTRPGCGATGSTRKVDQLSAGSAG